MLQSVLWLLWATLDLFADTLGERFPRVQSPSGRERRRPEQRRLPECKLVWHRLCVGFLLQRPCNIQYLRRYTSQLWSEPQSLWAASFGWIQLWSANHSRALWAGISHAGNDGIAILWGRCVTAEMHHICCSSGAKLEQPSFLQTSTIIHPQTVDISCSVCVGVF